MHVFIGYDRHQRLASLVLAHSLRRRSSLPITITLLEQHQLEQAGLYWRPRDPRQTTDCSFSRFLVSALLGFQGWGLYLDGDMLCLADPATLWELRDADEALLCVQHPSHPWGNRKMGGLCQTDYPRKNWSSLMLFNAPRSRAQTREGCHVDGITWWTWILRRRPISCRHCCTGLRAAPGCPASLRRVVLWLISGWLERRPTSPALRLIPAATTLVAHQSHVSRASPPTSAWPARSAQAASRLAGVA